MLRGIFQTKSFDDILLAKETPGKTLSRTLGPWNITLLGIGAIIGAGIFTTVGTAAVGSPARPGAGPSLMLSFAITATVCAFTALCYAEFASSVPVSGSAYTYSYATLGEFVAWIIGWDLMIEYAIGNVAVAISWASYFRKFLLESIGLNVPLWMATDYRSAATLRAADPEKYAEMFGSAPIIFGQPVIVNLLAFAIVMAITVVLVWGVKESARLNAVMVLIKILVLIFFIGVSIWLVSPSQMAKNWTPFQPNGWRGTMASAAVVFFAYIGFDAVSTVAEETKNPGRDLPFGIFASLIICTILYVVIAAVFTGLLSFDELKTLTSDAQAEPLTAALQRVAPPGSKWAGFAQAVVAFGAVMATTAVLLVFQLGQPRIFFAMARDGLLPPVFAKIHPRFHTPHVTTILTGLLVGGIAMFASIDEMVDLTNIGTLFAFVLVCIGIPILRYKDPDRARPFRVPFGPFLMPGLGVASCFFLMVYLPQASWWRFIGWLVLGLSVYASYGYAHSEVGKTQGRPSRTPAGLQVAAVGFLVTSIGMYVIPHHATPVHLVREAFAKSSPDHARAMWGLLLILTGAALGVGGTAKEFAKRS